MKKIAISKEKMEAIAEAVYQLDINSDRDSGLQLVGELRGAMVEAMQLILFAFDYAPEPGNVWQGYPHNDVRTAAYNFHQDNGEQD